ncbi:branched-chain amino acid ABC transporter permease [Mesorhizobium australicum]|uniref:Amino acid/amide ABC transporter membrane protein 2, HAAT family n=1 Tax=Mesorhizobium australicum TaxID=536018 RepID=A0A1X7MS03_9HYPH|nr:branched-chain amino acid ABC transporter permease [Mesorhizobium australicum]SMH27612.1 amino acid/amide ABC transporter membrane protein 2, HAAT family [Mesorhizobium australicum]
MSIQSATTTTSSRRGVPLSAVCLACLAAVALAAPFFVYPLFLMKILCFVLFASAVNLVLGFAGLLSLGHAAFFGGAAYVAAHSAKVWGFPFELAVLSAVAFSTLLGFVFGFLAIRRQGIYFAMVTLALAQMIYFLAIQMPFTGGEDGITAVPRGRLFGLVNLADSLAMYYVVLALVAFGLLVIWRTVHSPFGHVLAAIKENEARATSLGLQPNRYKLIAFTLSAALSGLAGALKAIAFQVASLLDVTWHMSGEVILMTLIGGMGTLIGPGIGAAFVVALEHYLSTSGLPITFIIGVIFMVCVMLFRKGIFGELRAWYFRWAGKD